MLCCANSLGARAALLGITRSGRLFRLSCAASQQRQYKASQHLSLPVVEGRDAHKVQTAVFKFSPKGFRINENFITGSVILFPKDVFVWRIKSWEGITPESVAVFAAVTPKPEIVVLGLGDSVQRLPTEVYQFFKDNDIRLEICSTVCSTRTPQYQGPVRMAWRVACQQFNHLSEGLWRNVAAALIPPTVVDEPRDVAKRLKPSQAG